VNGPAHRPGASCARCREPMRAQDRFCELCGTPAGTNAGRDHDRSELRAGRAAGITDRGLRHLRNEDALALRILEPRAGETTGATLCVVCDGVSSTPRPHEASAAAVTAGAQALAAALSAGRDGCDATEQALRDAAAAVADLVDPATPDEVPACTYVSATLVGGIVTIGWIGDSRAYWIPEPGGEHAVRLTEDDSWLTAVLADGALSPAQAAADRRAHAITGWLGADNPRYRAHCTTVRPTGPGVIVVCTDGLWNYMENPDALAAALPANAAEDALGAAAELTRTALRAGGRDNITVAILPVDPEPGGPS